MSEFVKINQVEQLPRLPLEGEIDLTHRCNFDCRHCWLRIPPGSPERKNELTTDEIYNIIEEARDLGCREWSISGGEPMLRPDFAHIFDYITSKSLTYSINTNGSLITPEIAHLMKRKGSKMVALYGATADVHDHITRRPGSFEATMRGFAYLKEAEAGFTVQLVPMRDNYHQYQDMIQLAESLSPSWRMGASWLYLSAYNDPERNNEILNQRLPPSTIAELTKPISASYYRENEAESIKCINQKEGDSLLTSCLESKRNYFHIDPYGQMSFCTYIKDPNLRFDLRNVTFSECWEIRIPSLAGTIKSEREFLENCGSCKFRSTCFWCPGYAYLEHQRFSAKIPYLCAVANERKKIQMAWPKNHRRFFQIADITIQVESDIPFLKDTFDPKFKPFEVKKPNDDIINIRHHFSIPTLSIQDLGKEVYRKPPWAIYKKGNSWIYTGILPNDRREQFNKVAIFNLDHTDAQIFNDGEGTFKNGGISSLSLFPSDQIILSRVLADKSGCYLHSSGVILNGQGLLFAGHSGAGKSTMVKMLLKEVELLCDDRNIIRKQPNGFRIYGTWSHGEIPLVSANSAPLKAIFFLEKSDRNFLVPIENRQLIVKGLLSFIIRPFVSVDWWEKSLSLIEDITYSVPCYSLYFNKSGEVVELLKNLQ